MKEKVIDVRGEMCPYPEMKTDDGLKEAKKEALDEIVVITDHPPAALLTIPQRLEQGGYIEDEDYTVTKKGSDWTFRIRIKGASNGA